MNVSHHVMPGHTQTRYNRLHRRPPPPPPMCHHGAPFPGSLQNQKGAMSSSHIESPGDRGGGEAVGFGGGHQTRVHGVRTMRRQRRPWAVVCVTGFFLPTGGGGELVAGLYPMGGTQLIPVGVRPRRCGV